MNKSGRALYPYNKIPTSSLSSLWDDDERIDKEEFIITRKLVNVFFDGPIKKKKGLFSSSDSSSDNKEKLSNNTPFWIDEDVLFTRGDHDSWILAIKLDNGIAILGDEQFIFTFIIKMIKREAKKREIEVKILNSEIINEVYESNTKNIEDVLVYEI